MVASYQNIKYSNASTTWRSLLTTCATFENKNLLGDTLFLYKNYETKKSSGLQFNSEHQKRACFLFWANITHSSVSPSPSKYNTHTMPSSHWLRVWLVCYSCYPFITAEFFFFWFSFVLHSLNIYPNRFMLTLVGFASRFSGDLFYLYLLSLYLYPYSYQCV